MKLIIFYTLICSILSVCLSENILEAGYGCIIQYLKDKGKLTQDFPSIEVLPYCRLAIPEVIKNVKKKISIKFAQANLTNAECVSNEFITKDGFDYQMMIEVIAMSKLLKEDEIKTQLAATKKEFKQVLEDIAKLCDSDPTYGGAFDDLLGIKNTTLVWLQRQNCFENFVLNSGLTTLTVDKEYDVEAISCEELVRTERVYKEKELVDGLNTQKLNQDTVSCILDSYEKTKMFEINLALETVERMDLPISIKQAEKDKLGEKMKSFVSGVLTCTTQNI